MTNSESPRSARLAWEQPEIRELDVRETSQFPGRGNDAGGSLDPDCQRS